MHVDQIGSQLQVLNILPVAAVTADGNSAGVDVRDYVGQLKFILDVSAPVAGSTPGLAVKIQHSDDNSSFTDVTGGGFTAVAADASVQSIPLKADDLKRYIRINLDISGTSSPQYLVSAKAVGVKQYR